jgi:hypothetical protein
MTGSVLVSRGANAISYSINDALTRIDQDVKASAGFLSANNITLSTGQGFDDNTGIFQNATIANGTMIILNSYATDQNPLTPTRNISLKAARCGDVSSCRLIIALAAVVFCLGKNQPAHRDIRQRFVRQMINAWQIMSRRLLSPTITVPLHQYHLLVIPAKATTLGKPLCKPLLQLMLTCLSPKLWQGKIPLKLAVFVRLESKRQQLNQLVKRLYQVAPLHSPLRHLAQT